ncbi:MAG: hypothetical protein WD009_13010 [Phycisphaeraceae bacterium]
MHALPTAILHHRTRYGSHYDWLVTPPHGEFVGADAGRLWTLRVAVEPERWRTAGVWEMEELAPHRAVYLRYEGPVPGGRGQVRRVDDGTIRAELWTRCRRVLDVRMAGFAGRVELHALPDTRHGPRWRGVVEPDMGELRPT